MKSGYEKYANHFGIKGFYELWLNCEWIGEKTQLAQLLFCWNAKWTKHVEEFLPVDQER